MAQVERFFHTQDQADAFVSGIQYVNDSAITVAWLGLRLDEGFEDGEENAWRVVLEDGDAPEPPETDCSILPGEDVPLIVQRAMEQAGIAKFGQVAPRAKTPADKRVTKLLPSPAVGGDGGAASIEVVLDSALGEMAFHCDTLAEAESCFARIKAEAVACSAADGISRTVRLVLNYFCTDEDA